MNENRFFLWTKILIKIKSRDKKKFIGGNSPKEGGGVVGGNFPGGPFSGGLFRGGIFPRTGLIRYMKQQRAFNHKPN